MSTPVAPHPVKLRAVADLLASAATEPSVLAIEGEPGIGKTTMWLTTLGEAVLIETS